MNAVCAQTECHKADIKDKSMLVIIDNGHGVDTKGKCSPTYKDGSKLWEYEFNRDIAARIAYLRCEQGCVPR